MATWNSQRSGLWSRTSNNADSPWHDGGAQTALAAIPANTDVVTIANTHDVEFDVDQSGFAAGITLTISAGGTLHASTTAGSYYLKLQNADMTLNGTLRAGTSTGTPYPSTCTFTIDHASNAKSIEVSATGHVYLYCTQPTNPYIYTSAASTGWDAMDQIKVATDVTADGPWSIANAQIRIVDATPQDSEIRTISSIAADEITVSAVVTNAKATASMVLLVTRNIRIINVGASDYAFTYASTAGSGDYIAAELNNVYRGISGGSGVTFAGTCEMLTTSPIFWNNASSSTFSGWVAAPTSGTSTGLSTGTDTTMSGVLAGFSFGVGGTNLSLEGLLFGCSRGGNGCYTTTLTDSAEIRNCSYGFQSSRALFLYGDIANCGRALYLCDNIKAANNTLTGSTAEIDEMGSGSLYNVVFSGGVAEFLNYTAVSRSLFDYLESFNHDGATNAYKAWCRGGVVTSQTTSPPTGYTIWYEHACESASYPCFRQYLTVVQPGASIEVAGKIRIADGEDLTSNPPALQIVDVFADPLVDSTQTPLDECEIPQPNGGVDNDWQDVSAIWANQGEAPRQVCVRMIAYHATADVDEVWSVATYQDQIATLYDILMPLKTTVATSDSTTSFTLTAGEATADAYNSMTLMVRDADDGHWEQRSIIDWTAARVITVTEAFSFTPAVGDLAYVMGVAYGVPTDLTPITSKLPTGFIMGSSDQNNHDTDIDAIKLKTDTIPASPAAVGSAMTLTAAYDAAKTAAQAGDQMDLVDAPNSTAVTAIQSGLSTHSAADVKTAIEAAGSHLTLILEDTGTTLPATLTTMEGKVDTADGVVDAIKLKTDLIPSSPAAVGSAMTLTSAYDAAKTALTPTTMIDGSITVDSLLECLLAFLAGKATVIDNGATRTITFYKQDGTTAKYLVNASDTDGSRAAAGEVDPA